MSTETTGRQPDREPMPERAASGGSDAPGTDDVTIGAEPLNDAGAVAMEDVPSGELDAEILARTASREPAR